MKVLKAIFTNALVLATLVTALAGTVLVAYSGDELGPKKSVRAAGSQSDDRVPTQRVAAPKA